VILGRPARKIFDLLEDAARNLVLMSTLLADLYDRFPEAGDRVVRIRAAEDEGDRITRALYEALHRTLSTPMPREHLLALARALDDVSDAIEEAATELELVAVRSVPERARAQARLVLQACERLSDAVERLRRRPNLEAEVADVYALEDEGDQLVRDAIARLFASGAEPLEIVRLKTLHDRLEQAVDLTKAAASTLERIAVTTR
jgi:predicted phosphate transport protein (TIGR00153 family)